MIWRILKKVLSFATVDINYAEGDLIHIRIKLGTKVVLDKVIDVIKHA